jgi:hypothetical protein
MPVVLRVADRGRRVERYANEMICVEFDTQRQPNEGPPNDKLEAYQQCTEDRDPSAPMGSM